MSSDWSFNQPVLLKKTRRNSSVLVWTLVGATTFAAIWAFVAPLPETVAVQGKLQPSSAIQDIEAPLGGVVQEVLVKEGDAVSEGQLLIRFDARTARSNLKSAEEKKQGLTNQIAINRALVGDLDPNQLNPNQRRLLESRRREFTESDEANQEAIARNQSRIDGLSKALASAEIIAERFQTLEAVGAASELRVLEAESKVDSLRSDLEGAQREQERLNAIANAESARREAQRRREIEDSVRTIADLDRDINQAQVLLSDVDVKAPIAGLVFDLSVQRGSVIQPSNEDKPLLKIIPQDELSAKVYIPNTAIGFIREGQRADISLNAFNSSDFGYLPSTVQQVGSDALTPEEQQSVLGTAANGLHFPAILKLGEQTLSVGQRNINLQPGMSLTADLHLRNRRFISAITDLFEDKRRSLERMR